VTDKIRARARRDGTTYGEAMRAMLAEAKAKKAEPLTYREAMSVVSQPREPKVHRRLSSVFTGPAHEDVAMRSQPRCRGYGLKTTGPVWAPEDPRLTDDPAAVTCGQCRRFDS